MVPLYPAGGQTRRGLKVKSTLWAVKGIFLEWYDIAFNSWSAVKYVPESEDVCNVIPPYSYSTTMAYTHLYEPTEIFMDKESARETRHRNPTNR